MYFFLIFAGATLSLQLFWRPQIRMVPTARLVPFETLSIFHGSSDEQRRSGHARCSAAHRFWSPLQTLWCHIRMLRLSAQLLLSPVCLRFSWYGRLLWLPRVNIVGLTAIVILYKFRCFPFAGLFSSLNQFRVRLKLILLSAKNLWIQWSLTLSDSSPNRVNHFHL